MNAPREHRKLHFDSIDQAMEEAERLARVPTRTTGRFSLGQILEHLARTLDVVTGDRQAPAAPLPVRLLARLGRPLVLRQLKPGFKLPSQAQGVLWPADDVPVQDGLQHLRAALQRFRNLEPLPPHVFFGKMTREEHERLQCRHFELHLGFVQATGAEAAAE
jgi:hypothetical protein